MRPVLFELPWLHLPVYAYGTMLYLSFALGWMLSLRLAEKDGLSRGVLKLGVVLTAIAALIGARLLFVITNPGLFPIGGRIDPDDVARMFDFRSGLVAYGGFLGGVAGSAVFCRLARVPFLVWADCAAPALCTGLMITRIGCLLAGCDFGAPWDGPWAIRFPPGSPAFDQQLASGLIPAHANSSLPVHPTQIYESAAGALLFALVWRVRGVRTAPGQALAAFGLGYGVLRFGIEMVRADEGRGSIGWFSTSQIIAIATSIIILLALAAARARSQRNLGAVARTTRGFRSVSSIARR